MTRRHDGPALWNGGLPDGGRPRGRLRAGALASALAAAGFLASAGAARAQAIDLSHGGPVSVTARDGIDWNQGEQIVVARGDARAIRGDVTVTADMLVAHYRKKAAPPGTVAKPAKPMPPVSMDRSAPPGAAQDAAPAAPGAASAAPGAAAPRVGTDTAASATAGAPGAAAQGVAPPTSAPPSSAPPTSAPPASASTDAPGAGGAAVADAAAPARPAGTAPGIGDDTGSNEIYRLEALGHVHIFTPTDQAWGDHATYDIDQAVLVLTGTGLKLVTPQDVLTARDAMEYWSGRHMSVGRGDAVVTTNDQRRVQADVLVGYTVDPNAPVVAGAAPARPAASAKPSAGSAKPGADPLTSSGKLQRVDGFGHVRVQTPTEIVTGDKGVYVPDTGIARIVGAVHITRGENVLNGAAAIVNMRTGLATLSQNPGTRVEGLIVPNSAPPTGAPGMPGAAPGVVPGAAGTRSAKPARADAAASGGATAGGAPQGPAVAATPAGTTLAGGVR